MLTGLTAQKYLLLHRNQRTSWIHILFVTYQNFIICMLFQTAFALLSNMKQPPVYKMLEGAMCYIFIIRIAHELIFLFRWDMSFIMLSCTKWQWVFVFYLFVYFLSWNSLKYTKVFIVFVAHEQSAPMGGFSNEVSLQELCEINMSSLVCIELCTACDIWHTDAWHASHSINNSCAGHQLLNYPIESLKHWITSVWNTPLTRLLSLLNH